MSSTKKTVVVFGATGSQGGSVINSLLADSGTASSFHIRGITRDPSKASAQALVKRGVECVTGDLDDPASLTSAFKGAYAVFAVTNYWEKMSGEVEFAQGKAIADTAKAEGVQHLIWSSLLDINELTKGEYPNVYHFDTKAKVEQYIRDLGIPATFFLPGYYMSNLVNMGTIRPNPQDESKYIFAFAGARSTTIPLFNAEGDTGKFVKAILKNREKTLGKQLYAATDYYTIDQIIDTFKATFPNSGKDFDYFHIPEADFKAALAAGMHAPEPVQNEMWENMVFMDKYGYYGKADLGETLALLEEKPTSLEDFFKAAPQLKTLN
ncbi:MAG: hypothetical protein M1814_005651 [Vezdaea aestivalis]|nr:MAG: hypothetical protein M1814_005651 [Vezdaea aestivalis]